jgi:hypothetical protein
MANYIVHMPNTPKAASLNVKLKAKNPDDAAKKIRKIDAPPGAFPVNARKCSSSKRIAAGLPGKRRNPKPETQEKPAAA